MIQCLEGGWNRHVPELIAVGCRAVRKSVPTARDAEDIVQDAFVAVLQWEQTHPHADNVDALFVVLDHLLPRGGTAWP
jgi:DNA-directed RNA polymerase specialized sigma24 family protein